MIGSPENDAALRLECWRIGVDMAGQGRWDTEAVAKLSTAVYNFIAGGEKSPSSSSGDKSKPTPRR